MLKWVSRCRLLGCEQDAMRKDESDEVEIKEGLRVRQGRVTSGWLEKRVC